MMAFIAVSFVRAVMGVVLATILALLGWFFGFMLWPPSWGNNALIAFLVLSTGIGAGIGGFVAWIRLDSNRMVNIVVLVAALVGGMLGAWAGAEYGEVTYEKGFPSPGRIATVLGSGFGANVVPFIVAAYWSLRGKSL